MSAYTIGGLSLESQLVIQYRGSNMLKVDHDHLLQFMASLRRRAGCKLLGTYEVLNTYLHKVQL
jgi:hypothetical protein